MFPFTISHLDVECEKGGSMVDSQGCITYIYTIEERQLIQKAIKKHQIKMAERDVYRILLTNAIKSIDPTMSEIIQLNHRIYIDKIDFIELEDNMVVIIDIVGRIG